MLSNIVLFVLLKYAVLVGKLSFVQLTRYILWYMISGEVDKFCLFSSVSEIVIICGVNKVWFEISGRLWKKNEECQWPKYCKYKKHDENFGLNWSMYNNNNNIIISQFYNFLQFYYSLTKKTAKQKIFSERKIAV